MDDFDIMQPRRRSSTQNLQVTPILDLLFTIIFFLMVATSFEDVTQHHLPPAQITRTLQQESTPALNPKIFVGQAFGKWEILLMWSGTRPGQIFEQIESTEIRVPIAKIIEAFEAKLKQLGLKNSYSEFQIGFTGDVDFQALIEIMDVLKNRKLKSVLVSPSEAQAFMIQATRGLGS